ncbi:transcriptional regulator, LysR family [Palleronia marisminoris]|uniref:HTH-type transcriptional regulator DmlR n=1 Tax=Palleronia marisminoris TaxID=315423 RepID=A0A1Y5RJY8_9RHOB|nr:transcriptional regulator, LysR family [Palleronia marisminoris]SLN18132.1 HTH-type transcriptional regulator DmlR [Palleronia marisminoris]
MALQIARLKPKNGEVVLHICKDARVNWDDARIFLGVARAGGLTVASRQLRLDPATLGRRVVRLEADLGAALFVKGPQGYRLTQEGVRLFDHAERAESALAAAESELQGALSGAVRIGAPEGCATYLLPAVTARMAEAHPGLEIEIVALPRVFDLNRREVDMAVSVSRPTTGRITVQKIADYGLSLAAHREYLAAHPVADAEGLPGHRVVGYVPDMIFDRELDYLGEIGVDRVDLASSSVVVQAQWIARGRGIGVIHDFMLGHLPGVERVLPHRIALTRAFWLLRPAGDVRAARLDAFAEDLVAGLRTEIRGADTRS